MTGPVDELLAVALGVDDPSGRSRRCASHGTPGPDRGSRLGLGRTEDREEVQELLVGPVRRVAAGDPQRPGDVAAVAPDRPADVEDDRLAGPDHPLGGLVVGRGAVRARSRRSRTRQGRGLRRPAAREPRARHRPRSGRPAGRRRSASTTRSAASAASRRSSISSVSLIIRSSRRTSPARSRRAAGNRSAILRTCIAQSRSLIPSRVSDPTGRPRASAASRPTSATGSSVSCQLATSTNPPLTAGQPRAGVTSRRGADQGRRTGCRNDEHRQSLERHRVIAGEVVEVRPDADEEGVEPRLRGQPACRGDPLAEAGRRDDRAGRNGGRHRPAISTGSGSPSHAAIVRGPASNSRR